MFERFKRGAARPTDPGIFECSVEACVMTDTGPRRQSNEDCGKVVWPDDSEQLAKKGVLVLVADGMGGHEGGEVASEMAGTHRKRNLHIHEGRSANRVGEGVSGSEP